jgi:hypothetical protein
MCLLLLTSYDFTLAVLVPTVELGALSVIAFKATSLLLTISQHFAYWMGFLDHIAI